MQKDVAIVVINFNSHKYTLECVEALNTKISSKVSYEIIVVDNGSEDEDFRILRENLPKSNLIFIRSSTNLGYSGGLDLGVKAGTAKHFFFLNNDCIIEDDAIEILHEFYRSHQDAGVIGGQIITPKGELERSFNYFPTLSMKLLGHEILNLFERGRYPYRYKEYKEAVGVPVISGCGMFISKEKLEGIGGIDTNYFLYCEEEDLALRLERAGYRNYFVPASTYMHYGGMSTNLNTLSKKLQFHKSLLYFYRKNYGILYAKLNIHILTLKFIVKGFRNKQFWNLARFINQKELLETSEVYKSSEKKRAQNKIEYTVLD